MALNISFNSCSAPTKFVPLSDITAKGIHRRLVIGVNAERNESVPRFQAISKWTARVAAQVKRQRYSFVLDLPLSCFVIKGPAYFTPHLANGFHWLSQSSLRDRRHYLVRFNRLSSFAHVAFRLLGLKLVRAKSKNLSVCRQAHDLFQFRGYRCRDTFRLRGS